MSAAFFYVHNVGPFIFSLLWFAAARWVHVDARGRLRNPRGVRAATVAALVLPFAGAALWALVRPAETLAHRRERRLLRAIREQELLPGRDILARGRPGAPEEAVPRQRLPLIGQPALLHRPEQV